MPAVPMASIVKILFSEFVLPMHTQSLAANDQSDAAIAFAEVNAKYFPESSYTTFVLGELNSATGQTQLAIKNLTRSMELNPRARFFFARGCHRNSISRTRSFGSSGRPKNHIPDRFLTFPGPFRPQMPIACASHPLMELSQCLALNP